MRQIPKLRFKEFNKIWEKTKIGDIANIIGGGTPSTENSKYWGEDINWFTPTEVGKRKYVINSQKKITYEGLKSSSAKLLPKGSILLSSRATIGHSSITTDESTTNQGFQSLIIEDGIDSEFIYYLISNIKKELIKRASGSTFLEITKKEMSKININIPSINEQEKIAIFLSNLSKFAYS